MKRIVERCCGLDVHKTSVIACVKVPTESGGSYHQEVERFATTTRGVLKLRDWLGSFKVELVGMEATGVYWKPIYYLLEGDFELWLLNALHLKNVPGRNGDLLPHPGVWSGYEELGEDHLDHHRSNEVYAKRLIGSRSVLVTK
jgi:transposase